jgi:hypothetical protein
LFEKAKQVGNCNEEERVNIKAGPSARKKDEVVEVLDLPRSWAGNPDEGMFAKALGKLGELRPGLRAEVAGGWVCPTVNYRATDGFPRNNRGARTKRWQLVLL